MVLALTSPRMKGPAVRQAQNRLNNNDFGDFLLGKNDGIFQEEDARACKRARFWLGFKKEEINGRYSEELDGYLSGKVKLPAAYRERRQERKEDAKKPKLREVALTMAKGEVGYQERGGTSNITKYGDWYGMNGVPWCGQFVSWCYVHAAKKHNIKQSTFRAGSHYAYVPAIDDDARMGRNGLSKVRNPVAGDLVLFQFDNDPNEDHVEMFVDWINKDAGTFRCIGGNTGNGEVKRTDRSRSVLAGFAHYTG